MDETLFGELFMPWAHGTPNVSFIIGFRAAIFLPFVYLCNCESDLDETSGVE